MEARRGAHEQGQWVREALLAYSRRNGGSLAA
jgi:hypothetical protein